MASFLILCSTLFFGQLRETGIVHVRTLLPQPAYAVAATPTPVTPAPVVGDLAPPTLSSSHWEVMDLGSGEVLVSRNPDDRVAIASLTKLMTAYLVRRDDKLSDLVTIEPEDVAIGSDDSRMNLVVGEKISVEDLLKGLLIPSGDDAALALARDSAGSVDAFVQQMNSAAEQLGLTNTHFVNPSGLDAEGHFSTAADLTQLARLIIADPILRDIAATREATVKAETGQVHQLFNTNSLLGQDGITGIKTGHTDEAGDCLISLETIDGHEIITTLLGSSDRFGETEQLIDWTRADVRW
jgi:D-alanyl-D-alanine carboxypeptidase (penicillin-binding protein 5/6)